MGYTGCPTATFAILGTRFLISIRFYVVRSVKTACFSGNLVPTDLNARCHDLRAPQQLQNWNCLINFLEQSSASEFGTFSTGQKIPCSFIPILLLSLLLTYLLAYVLTYWLTYILTYLFTYLFTYLITYLLACLHTYLLTYIHTYLLIYLLT